VRYFSIFAFDPLHLDAQHLDAQHLDAQHLDAQHLDAQIPQTLLDWLIERAHEKVDLAPQGARVVLHISANQANQPMYEFLSRNGFQVVRCSYRMHIDFDDQPAKPDIPEGITIRSIANKADERAAYQAAFDSFRDHWGFIEEPFEAYYQRWIHQLTGDPNYDPSLFFIALDGDEVAGVSLCYPRTEEDAGMAWVGTLGVRRAWRKRGLGSALLLHSFNAFYERGIRRAGLGVDAENLTGALRLYEKAGMRPWRKNATYEMELRPGKDLMKKE
jgi:ribosomal protein S18 acetylase RimI-like enzyme